MESAPFSCSPTSTGGFSPNRGGSVHKIGHRDVLGHLCKGAHPSKFTSARGKSVLLFGHGLSGSHEDAFCILDISIEDVIDCAKVFWCFGLTKRTVAREQT